LEAIHVRPATADDFDTIYGFVRQLSTIEADEQMMRAIYELNLSSPDNIYLIAYARHVPVGFISCHVQELLHHGGPVGEIQELYVRENARGMGAGKMLLDRVKEIAGGNGVLQLEVAAGIGREAAHRFYLREGFADTHKKFVWK
jgi:PhnO protein